MISSVQRYHGANRKRGFLLDHGLPVVSASSLSGGDIYIACPFWDSPFKLLVFLRPHVYVLPCRRKKHAHVDVFAPSTRKTNGGKYESEIRKSIRGPIKFDRIGHGEHVPVVRCERVQRARSVNKAAIVSSL